MTQHYGETLNDDLYCLHEMGAALQVGGFRLHINARDDGVLVNVFDAQVIHEDEDYDRAHLRSVLVHHQDRDDPDTHHVAEQARPIGDALYELDENCAAFDIDGFRVHIEASDLGLSVCVYDTQVIVERDDHEAAHLGSTVVPNVELSDFAEREREPLEA